MAERVHSSEGLALSPERDALTGLIDDSRDTLLRFDVGDPD
jgi:hypothetical protein